MDMLCRQIPSFSLGGLNQWDYSKEDYNYTVSYRISDEAAKVGLTADQCCCPVAAEWIISVCHVKP